MSGFSNPIIGGGGGLVYPSIHSPDFSLPGNTGWAILKDGSAFFFNVTTSGNVIISGSGGWFVYDGAPALGNPPTAYAVAEGVFTDPFGNDLPSSGGVVSLSETGWSVLADGALIFNEAGQESTFQLLLGGQLNISISNAGILQLASATTGIGTLQLTTGGIPSLTSGDGDLVVTGADGSVYDTETLTLYTTASKPVGGGLSLFTAPAAKDTTYEFEAVIHAENVTAQSVNNFTVSGPASSLAVFRGNFLEDATSGGIDNTVAGGFGTYPSPGSGYAAGSPYTFYWNGIFTTTAAGGFSVTCTEGTPGDNWNILAGSRIKLRPIRSAAGVVPPPAPFPSALTTSGRAIVDTNGYTMPFLKGFNVQIFNSAIYSQADFSNMFAEGARIVRIVIFWDFIEQPAGHIPATGEPNYLTNLDNAIQWACNAGLYVILNLYFGPAGVHCPPFAQTVTTAPASATANYIANGQNITQFLATRYGPGGTKNPVSSGGGAAIIGFQINEPTPDIQSSGVTGWLSLLFAEQVQMANWIRAIAPQWIIFFSAGFGDNAILPNATGSGQGSSQNFLAAPANPFTTVYSSTVAAGSNGVNPSTSPAFDYISTAVGGGGTLDVTSVSGALPAGLLVITHGAATMLVAYAGISGSSFTGCYWISGYTGAIATGDTVAAVAGTLSAGGNPNFATDLHGYELLCDTTRPTTVTWDGRTTDGAGGPNMIRAQDTTNSGGNNYTIYPPEVGGSFVAESVTAGQQLAFMASHLEYSINNDVPFCMLEWGWTTYNGTVTWSGGTAFAADWLNNMVTDLVAISCQWDYRTSTSGDPYAARPGKTAPGDVNAVTGWQDATDKFMS